MGHSLLCFHCSFLSLISAPLCSLRYMYVCYVVIKTSYLLIAFFLSLAHFLQLSASKGVDCTCTANEKNHRKSFVLFSRNLTLLKGGRFHVAQGRISGYIRTVVGTACCEAPPTPLSAAELCSGTVVSLSVVLSKHSTRIDAGVFLLIMVVTTTLSHY